jgi:uncharacterized surface protein with fasciclin (FAS1) repeats
MMKGDKISGADARDGTAKITITNVNQSNRVIHVVDHVAPPQ